MGKGWYNMQENNPEVYKISKLKKFMTTVKFIMQDSLRFLVLNSFSEFNKSITSITSQKILINGTNDVKVFDTSSSDKGVVENARRPLFLIDLTFKNGKIGYNTPLSQYEAIIISIYDKALAAVEGLPQLV